MYVSNPVAVKSCEMKVMVVCTFVAYKATSVCLMAQSRLHNELH